MAHHHSARAGTANLIKFILRNSRRIKLSLDGPLQALWETIGRCGEPPRDPAKIFGLIGIILALLPWILIPTGLLVSWITELF